MTVATVDEVEPIGENEIVSLSAVSNEMKISVSECVVATEYHIQIFKNPTVVSTPYHEEFSTDNTFNLSDASLYEGYWYIRVRALSSNGNWGGWSQLRNFYVNNEVYLPKLILFQEDTNILSNDEYNFRNTEVGSSTSVVFTIKNAGNIELNLNEEFSVNLYAVDGEPSSDFQVDVQPVSPVSMDGESTFTLSFTPASSGIKTAKVTILNDSENESFEFTVIGNTDMEEGGLTADFTAAPTSGTAPLSVQFTDQSTSSESSIASWNWDFNDGSTSTEQNPSYTFNTANTYNVELTVTTEDDETDSIVKNIYVNDAGTVATPVISPSGSSFSDSVSVSISCSTSGATIRYTTNGSNPTTSYGTVYSGSFTLSSTTTVMAIAYKSGLTTSSIVSQTFTKEATLPLPAINPSPSHTLTGASIYTDPSWSNGGGATSYDVYFGTDSSPEFKGNQSITSYNPGTLSYDTTYYWRIDAKNSAGTTTGTVWRFTTGVDEPDPTTNPIPSHTATGVSVNIDLSWSNGGGATSYDVYFGMDSSPDSGEFIGNQPGTSYNLGTLSYNTTYYWRIDAKNSAGTTTGTVWRFTTQPPLPNAPINPIPNHLATDVSISNAYITWNNGGGATSYDVYFGTDSSPDSGEFIRNMSGNTHTLGTLSYDTTYYWRIDAKNSTGTTTGTVWRFTTEELITWWLSCSDDSQIKNDMPDYNQGDWEFMQVGRETSTRALMDFDVAAVIPTGTSIVNATLRLYQNSYFSGGSVLARIAWITSSWTESSVTWNTRPSCTWYTTRSFTLPGSTGYVYFDVTNEVQRMVDDGLNYGLMILPINEGTSPGVTIRTHDYDNGSYSPRLTIEYVQ